MKTFLEWLNESKSIVLSQDINNQVNESLPDILGAAEVILRSQNKYPDGLHAATIKFQNPYTNKENVVEIYVISKQFDYAASYQRISSDKNKIKINVWGMNLDHPLIRPKYWQEIELSLTHELIHSIDPKLDIFKKYITPEEDQIEYQKQSIEFDAYVGQVVDYIIKSAEDFEGTGSASVGNWLNYIISFLRNPNSSIKVPFSPRIHWPWEQIYQFYLKNGSEKQNRKMKQRIYNAVVQAQKILG
jgi:hypothetical protein